MRKILIVEDDESIGELLRDYLEINGFSVDICMNGTEGLKRIRDGEYDLLILDIMLPGMNGYEILKKIRDEKDIPVLIVSAKKEEFDKIHGLKLGADDYITKPFSPGELVARVTTYMIKSILEAFGQKVGLVGTIANMIGHEVLPTDRTTPESYDLQELFSEMVQKNVNSVVMEVSSHALELHRVSCCEYEIGVFTNLSRDHLDFHKTLKITLMRKSSFLACVKKA